MRGVHMKTPGTSCLIAVVGGSGAGKTWLADQLQTCIGKEASRLSLDDFYLDRSSLTPIRREKINFDHPRAIDWPCVERVLCDCKAGRPTSLPRYDFSRHTRSPRRNPWRARPLIIMDGLWLLHRPAVRCLFDFRIFIDCSVRLRLRRRLERDVAERGRTRESVRHQFATTVAPMHERYVEPQVRWADIVVTSPVGRIGIYQIAEQITKTLMQGWHYRTWMRQRFETEVQRLERNGSYL